MSGRTDGKTIAAVAIGIIALAAALLIALFRSKDRNQIALAGGLVQFTTSPGFDAGAIGSPAKADAAELISDYKEWYTALEQHDVAKMDAHYASDYTVVLHMRHGTRVLTLSDVTASARDSASQPAEPEAVIIRSIDVQGDAATVHMLLTIDSHASVVTDNWEKRTGIWVWTRETVQPQASGT